MLRLKKTDPDIERLTPAQREIHDRLQREYKEALSRQRGNNIRGSTLLTSGLTAIVGMADFCFTGGLGTATIVALGGGLSLSSLVSRHCNDDIKIRQGQDLARKAVEIDARHQKEIAKRLEAGAPKVPAMLKLLGCFNDATGAEVKQLSLPDHRVSRPKPQEPGL